MSAGRHKASESAASNEPDRDGTSASSNNEARIVSVASLAHHRHSRELDRHELALRCGLTPASLHRIEHQGRAMRKTAHRLASALGVSVEELADPNPAQSPPRGKPPVPQQQPPEPVAAENSPLGHNAEHESSANKTFSTADYGQESEEGYPTKTRGQIFTVFGLEDVRDQADLSQRDLARLSDVTPATIARVEEKGRAMRMTVEAVASALDRDLSEFAELESNSGASQTATTQMAASAARRAGDSPRSSSDAESHARTGAASANGESARDDREPDREPDREAAPPTIVLSEPVQRRVNRLLDILREFFGGRRS